MYVDDTYIYKVDGWNKKTNITNKMCDTKDEEAQHNFFFHQIKI